MVEVFRTNVRKTKQARPLAKSLLENFPNHKITFDLEDCDKILRVEGQMVNALEIINALTTEGFQCNILE